MFSDSDYYISVIDIQNNEEERKTYDKAEILFERHTSTWKK